MTELPGKYLTRATGATVDTDFDLRSVSSPKTASAVVALRQIWNLNGAIDLDLLSGHGLHTYKWSVKFFGMQGSNSSAISQSNNSTI